MWLWRIASGTIEHNGALIGRGYSGHGDGVNNPSMQAAQDVGPIPCGLYNISTFFTDLEKGPMVAHLWPKIGTNTFGRSGFMIHGDNSQGNESASHGCIILPHTVREMVRDSGDTDLEVVAA